MKHANICLCALLCGTVLAAVPAMAAGTVTTPAGTIQDKAAAHANAAVGVSTPDNTSPAANTASTQGASTSLGGLSASGDVNSPTLGNNAGSVNTAVQTPAHRISRKAQSTANAAEVETTRQLNQQAAASVRAGASVQ